MRTYNTKQSRQKIVIRKQYAARPQYELNGVAHHIYKILKAQLEEQERGKGEICTT